LNKIEQVIKLLPKEFSKVFKMHTEDVNQETVDFLMQELDSYLKKIQNIALNNPNIDLKTVQKMVDTCKSLLTSYSMYDADERAVITGAVRYFLDENDASDDLNEVFGFDDDLAVLNAVTITLGKTDLLIQR
jgi:uncharacterized membrane protein YkvA (DUF1232 family)